MQKGGKEHNATVDPVGQITGVHSESRHVLGNRRRNVTGSSIAVLGDHLAGKISAGSGVINCNAGDGDIRTIGVASAFVSNVSAAEYRCNRNITIAGIVEYRDRKSEYWYVVNTGNRRRRSALAVHCDIIENA